MYLVGLDWGLLSVMPTAGRDTGERRRWEFEGTGQSAKIVVSEVRRQLLC